MNKSAELRYMLACVGIKLDDPIAPSEPKRTVARIDPDIAERDRIREILIAAGAPGRDIGWLTASCPGVAAAHAYAPPPDRESEYADE